MRIFGQLYIQVLIAIVCAVLVGLLAPDFARSMKPLGDLFIALLRMMLAPIIFCSVVLGLTHVADMKQLGRLALKTLIYFELVTTVAMVLGFAAANIFRPGDGLHAQMMNSGPALAQVAGAASEFTALHFLMSIVPKTLVGAFADGEILQVLFVSLLVGAALSIGGVRPDSALLRGIDEAQTILFRILGFIMRLAPLGAFGALAAALGSFGPQTLLYLTKLVLLYWATSLVFVVCVLGGILMALGISLGRLVSLIRDEMMLVLGTASGEVVLPRLIAKLEACGCDKAVVGFVVPAGYSFNLDGTAIYMALAVGFIAQATDTPLGLADQIAILAVIMLTSKGGTAVAGGAFVKLAATLQTVQKLPLNGLGLLFGVDRLMATCTALTNIIGNCVAVLVVARWEGGFDKERFERWTAAEVDAVISGGGTVPHAEETRS
ncbi:cation:dicarboxylate symporter family transporter [Sphingobium lignivorans]|uniref:Aerobic C4-dicarboxylate transport protein n=1 Tax=Sphingobium lignivorans TaxID=2735886 RepID=A0ABR6NIM2_9SPHN|nr:cation:dicarboxylase symporter family transporter [Sphingobium lignivorans]MBB5987124.1 aerobic C4-dicarboxylate transport protein [Sphingobium lignivorans]